MSLYLKYRPKDFDSLVGQNFIKETLQEAVKSNKTVGAYLFCGPRGTGKTSTARIMAKALNCKNIKNGNPCNNCDICNAINNENLVDVIEIDAASHTGVDNIRELIERAQFSPSHSKYKVYIIDEVHMLSKGAFNALLKTLEEPPKYVKFILATTETHKVPDTIISRCQRYDFKRISENDIKNRISHIAKEEKIDIDNKSLDYISKNSGGGLRNAINLFEQLTVNSEIKYENVINILGIVNDDILENFSSKLLEKNNTIIQDFENLIEEGKNIKLFFKELIFYIKDKTISQIKENKDISKQIEILEILDETYSKTKNSLDENTTFLVAILKILNGNTIKNKEENNKIIVEKNTTLNTPENKDCVYSNIQEQETEEELKIDEIGDIFSSSPTQEKSETQEENTSKSESFNKEDLIKKLKELGAKGALTMSIRGAECKINQDNFEIIFPTTFALKGANTSDNQTLINKALSELNLENLNLILKTK